MKKDAFYFKHDSNARNDEKLLAVRRKYGMDGYGIYWAIIEKLREERDYKLTTEYSTIAWELHCDESVITSIINDFGLFTIENNRFWSERLCEDMEEWNKHRTARSEAGKKGMAKRWGDKSEKQPTQAEIIEPPITTPPPTETSPKTAQKPRNKKYSEAERNLHNQCKATFSEIYAQYKGVEYYWQAKDMSAIVCIIKKIQFQMPEEEREDYDQVATNFSAFCKVLYQRADDWTKANASPTVINSKFNEIYTQLKNGTRNGNKSSAENKQYVNARDDQEYLASLVAELRSCGNQ